MPRGSSIEDGDLQMTQGWLMASSRNESSLKRMEPCPWTSLGIANSKVRDVGGQLLILRSCSEKLHQSGDLGEDLQRGHDAGNMPLKNPLEYKGSEVLPQAQKQVHPCSQLVPAKAGLICLQDRPHCVDGVHVLQRWSEVSGASWKLDSSLAVRQQLRRDSSRGSGAGSFLLLLSLSTARTRTASSVGPRGPEGDSRSLKAQQQRRHTVLCQRR